MWCLRIAELRDGDGEFFTRQAGEWMRKRAEFGPCSGRSIDEATPRNLVGRVELARFWHSLTVAGLGCSGCTRVFRDVVCRCDGDWVLPTSR